MCTLKLVVIAYQRKPWLRLVREPMLAGMRILARWHHIRREVEEYPFPTANCCGCIRFYKTLLFRKSRTFRWLHGRLNPIFNYFIDRIITQDERKRAREYALAASSGTLSEDEISAWMHGIKQGL